MWMKQISGPLHIQTVSKTTLGDPPWRPLPQMWGLGALGIGKVDVKEWCYRCCYEQRITRLHKVE